MRATEFNVPTLEAQDEKPVTIMLPPIALDQSHVQQLGQILSNHPGPCEVKLALMDDKGNAKVLTFGDRFRVRRDTSLSANSNLSDFPTFSAFGLTGRGDDAESSAEYLTMRLNLRRAGVLVTSRCYHGAL